MGSQVEDGNTRVTELDVALVPAVDRAAKLLAMLENAERPVALADAARQLNANKSSVRTILETMRHHELVERDSETKRYRLGRRLVALGTAVLRGRLDIAAISRPYLSRLAERTGLSASILVRQEDMAVFLQQVEASFSIGVSIPPGWRIPIYGGAAGKVFAAHLPEGEYRRLVSDLPHFTSRTIVDTAAFEKEIGLVRRQGYATSDQEYFEGIRAVAAPVLGLNGELLAVVHVRGVAGMVTVDTLESYGAQVAATAKVIAAALGVRLEAQEHPSERTQKAAG